MTSPSVSYLSKTLLSILFAGCLALTPRLVRAQDYTEEEYKSFQDIQAEKDDVKKADMAIKFLQASPKNGLRPNVVAEYEKAIVNLKNEKQWAEIISLGEKFLGVAPGNDFTEQAMTVAFAQTGNSRGFAQFGEKVYASKPSPGLAMEIAKAYQKIGNDSKYYQWREKVLASEPDNLEILTDMIKRNSQNLPVAVKYANQTLKALPTAKKPEGVSEATWKDQVNQTYAIAYGVIGANAYQNNSYGLAIKNLDSAVRYYKRYDMAYYYLGMSYWRTGRLEAAMLNFAKAYIIRGATAASAKQYLDQLYKSSHRNSLVGEDRIIERANQDLK
jgi:tetratricopeptide (TPR) repeat protein